MLIPTQFTTVNILLNSNLDVCAIFFTICDDYNDKDKTIITINCSQKGPTEKFADSTNACRIDILEYHDIVNSGTTVISVRRR